jgi:two-component system NtrC family sensor kinase
VFSDLRERRCSETRSRRSEELALRSQLLASVAHELNNPLTIVALQSQLLSKADPAIPGFREHLEIIQDQIGRMKRIIEQLCISSDSNGLRLETIDINALVRRALELQEHQLRQVEAQVAMDLAQDLPDIQVDPHRLQQVFVNLITNACQALTTTAPPRRLWVATTLVSEGRGRALGVQIRFTDNGPGISPEIMPHLFEPFFTTKKPGQGMGLGLSICDGIVREHGGRIWAQQKESSGATFVIELPAIRRAEDRQGSPLVPSRRRPVEQQAVPCIPEERAHILVVDDEPEMVHAAEQLLRQEGFEVTTAIEVQQALALLEQVRIDLVISDLAMPRIDGSRFYQIVTSRYPHLANRIIFSTGDSGSQRLGAFLRECGCAWIDKPFQPDELFSLIHRALRKGGASVVAQDKQ